MSRTNDQFYNDLINDAEDVANMDFLASQGGSLDEFLEPFKIDEDFPNLLTGSLVSFNGNQQSPSEVSSESNNEAVPRVTTSSSYNSQPTLEHLEMIEQPHQSSKLRYRADYTREKGRLGALGNKNDKSKIKGPAISIPQCYLNTNKEYYIRVSLVTIKYSQTNLHYFHPYEFEHPRDKELNDRQNNSIWFPIERKDSIKNFPLLRIVKKKSLDIQKLDYLRVFDYHNEILQNTVVQQHFLKKNIDIIKEYNLEKSQLAFTLGEKIYNNGQSTRILYPNTTIFSDEMDENDERQSDTDTDGESSSERQTSSSSNRFIYKYAPRSGFVGSDDEMLLFLKKKLQVKKYGELQIIFECNTFEGPWSQTVADLDIKDRLISFKIPIFPYPITGLTMVDIVLRQDHRILGVLKYSYLPSWQWL